MGYMKKNISVLPATVPLPLSVKPKEAVLCGITAKPALNISRLKPFGLTLKLC